MTIKELMKKYGDGKYIIETQENIYMGSYGMMGYTLYTHFELIVKNKNIYSESIYKKRHGDKEYITDINEKMKLVQNMLEVDYDNNDLRQDLEETEKFIKGYTYEVIKYAMRKNNIDEYMYVNNKQIIKILNEIIK